MYRHILPREHWKLNLWPGIKTTLPAYLAGPPKIERHTGSRNLCSSWILCANLYFPFRAAAGRELLASFLRDVVSGEIVSVDGVELEYEDPGAPPSVLGETDGHRGSGQTSPDVAFIVTVRSGRGVVLVECKFTEHGFYSCSGRKKKDPLGRQPNPDPSRCRNCGHVLDDPQETCHLTSWNRHYWDYLKPIVNREVASRLTCCPAAAGGYQLFRQHALAQAIASRGEGAFVASAVAYDSRNDRLMRCMARSTNLADVRTDWSRLFDGDVAFKTFTHQSWVAWVARHDRADAWSDWTRYVCDRYGFSTEAEFDEHGVASTSRPRTSI